MAKPRSRRALILDRSDRRQGDSRSSRTDADRMGPDRQRDISAFYPAPYQPIGGPASQAEFRYAVPRRIESAPIAGRPAGTLPARQRADGPRRSPALVSFDYCLRRRVKARPASPELFPDRQQTVRPICIPGLPAFHLPNSAGPIRQVSCRAKRACTSMLDYRSRRRVMARPARAWDSSSTVPPRLS
jgi:hypothetical protein